MFVTNIVVGLVCIFHPFRLTRRPFLRDNLYYIFATYWIFFLLWENEISLWEAVGQNCIHAPVHYAEKSIDKIIKNNFFSRSTDFLHQLCASGCTGELNLSTMDKMEDQKQRE